MKFIIILLLLPVLAFAQDDSFTSTKALAEQGDADAQFNLGVNYDNGTGVPQNDTEAVKWYRLAAEQGVAEAQVNLGTMYGNGKGVPQNYARAYLWFSMAAAQGDEMARGYRDIASDQLSVGARNTAQKRATRCFDSDFKDCD